MESSLYVCVCVCVCVCVRIYIGVFSSVKYGLFQKFFLILHSEFTLIYVSCTYYNCYCYGRYNCNFTNLIIIPGTMLYTIINYLVEKAKNIMLHKEMT
jgi:hypothetical protein